MVRSFAILACLMVVIGRATSFMLVKPGSMAGACGIIRAQGAAVSDFRGDAVYERQIAADCGTLRMMVIDNGLSKCHHGHMYFRERHRKGFKKLNLPADQRKALLRGLTTQLIRHGRIKTTMVRAKAMRKPVEHMITLSKQGTLHARRQALAYIYDKSLVAALFESGPDRYGDRPGGYTRIIRVEQPRKGDSAKMAVIELV